MKKCKLASSNSYVNKLGLKIRYYYCSMSERYKCPKRLQIVPHINTMEVTINLSINDHVYSNQSVGIAKVIKQEIETLLEKNFNGAQNIQHYLSKIDSLPKPLPSELQIRNFVNFINGFLNGKYT
ncbi:hypothetical protein BpHYR1_033747 [Brachionus plicatilis]|uniref:Uncharacterized protein n=1 Tax=Brachionus plicatilis TaxID=10195 RepID=A0A3M7T2B9_BRAPC|nr:hypothetical protein BpHYR1_033747 [Brachionus plicatilis]